MKMMVDTAAQADQTQFILITPQDMGVRTASLFRFRARKDGPLTPPPFRVRRVCRALATRSRLSSLRTHLAPQVRDLRFLRTDWH